MCLLFPLPSSLHSPFCCPLTFILLLLGDSFSFPVTRSSFLYPTVCLNIHPSPNTLLSPALSNPDTPAAMALVVTGAAIYRRRHTRLRTSAPRRALGGSQRSGGAGRGTNRGFSPSRSRGTYGGSTRSRGTLGTRTPPSPAQPEAIPDSSQR